MLRAPDAGVSPVSVLHFIVELGMTLVQGFEGITVDTTGPEAYKIASSVNEEKRSMIVRCCRSCPWLIHSPGTGVSPILLSLLQLRT
jgi:hypothetical protein